MERLTKKKLSDFNPEIDFCVECRDFGEPCGCNRADGTCGNYALFNEVYGRLSELEDKLESGHMVEFPCKVGDYVYIIDNDRHWAKITGIYIYNEYDEQHITYSWEQYEHGVDVTELWDAGTFWDSAIGKSVFLEKENEERIKELQDAENLRFEKEAEDRQQELRGEQ